MTRSTSQNLGWAWRSIFVIGLAWLGGLALADRVASGVVFHDLNGNGIFDEGEMGIPGQPVSNGTEIAVSDRKGLWSIKAPEHGSIFVMPRAGWKTPVDTNGLPQFYYIHKPEGSPELKYGGSQPTGGLPKRIDFPLLKAASSEAFTIVVFGDPQPRVDEHIDFFARDIVSEVASIEGLAFGLSLGDIVSDDLSLYEPINQAVGLLGLPWHNVLGNHDLDFDSETDAYSDETYESVYGPPNYAFQHGKVHFLMLDDVVYGGATFAARIKSGEISGRKTYIGGFREDQFAFIENYLEFVEKDELVVLSMHIPLFDRASPHYVGVDAFRDEDRLRLFELLKDFPNTLSFSAHTHFQKQYFFDENDGWKGQGRHHHVNLGTTNGDWYQGLPTYDGFPDTTMRDGTPNGYAILSFDGSSYDLRYKVAGASADKQMSLHVSYPWEEVLGDRYLYANFYIGTEDSKVWFRIGKDEDWLPMEWVYEPDPRSIVRYREHKELVAANPDHLILRHRLISQPHPCSHLWKAKLPAHLPEGFQKAEVRATDWKGREYRDAIVFR